MKAEGTREKIAYMEAKKQYLAIGKRYSALLKEVMDLDPRVLKIAEEILAAGDSLSLHDNLFITTFYNELKSKSKINKKYYDILLELKKTKSELDNSTHSLSAKRVAYLLRQAGIPSRRTNQSQDSIVSQINNREVSLIEKISLPGVLSLEFSEGLDELVSRDELVVEMGKLVPKTRVARDFIRNLEKDVRGQVNNKYFLTGDDNLLRRYGSTGKNDLLEFIRLSADEEHVREIERKIDSGDVTIEGGTIRPLNEKGRRYLALLTEELGVNLDKKIKKHLLDKNEQCVSSDLRIGGVSAALHDLDISVAKHQRLDALAGTDSLYRDLVQAMEAKKEGLNKKFSELMTLNETISVSYADIKKQLLGIVRTDRVDIERVLAVLVAVRYLSVYERQYESKLVEIETLLGLPKTGGYRQGPESVTRLKERYRDRVDAGDDADSLIREIISTRLSARRELGPETNEMVIRSLLDSPQFTDYKEIALAQKALRQHTVDTLRNNHCLYGGLNDISELLADLAELEIEKNEKITELVHELELAHKELWLARIKNDSARYIDTNFADVPEDTKKRSLAVSNGSISNARAEIRQILARYRDEHRLHGLEFQKQLRDSLRQVSNGGDVTKISANLKNKYTEMQANHERLLDDLENDMLKYEKRLLEFEEQVPENLEKVLISDIRSNI